VGIGLQSTGKIVIGLSTFLGADDDGFTLVRFNTNGTLDTSFGTGGSVIVSPFNLSFIVPSVLAIQPNDDIVLAGSGAVARFTANGTLDTSFGTNGVASVPSDSSTSIALEPNRDVLLGTGSHLLGPTPPQGTNTQGTVVRLLANGTVDTSFGIAGQVATLPAAAAIAVQSNGEILVAGTQQRLVSGSSTLFQIPRFDVSQSMPIAVKASTNSLSAPQLSAIKIHQKCVSTVDARLGSTHTLQICIPERTCFLHRRMISSLCAKWSERKKTKGQ
jgi:uncharacterized delta-60 repeat protein